MSEFTVENWNRSFPIGTPVRYWPGQRGDETGRCGRTRSAAYLLAREPVVLVEGHTGAVALSHVQPLEVPPLNAEQASWANELLKLAEGMPTLRLEIEPADAIVLISQLQLALRHPMNIGRSANRARALAVQLQSIFPERARELLDTGWNEEYDQRASEVKWSAP